MTDTVAVEFVDLYKRRDDLKREIAAVEYAIEKCQHHNWAYVPPTAFEDRDGAWARVTYRTCPKCGVVSERVDTTPRAGLGEWRRLEKFRKESAKA